MKGTPDRCNRFATTTPSICHRSLSISLKSNYLQTWILRCRTAGLGQTSRQYRTGMHGVIEKLHVKKLEAEVAKLRSTRATLSKTVFGRNSEKTGLTRTGRCRGQQAGGTGHGRTQRLDIEKNTEVYNPPAADRHCQHCGKPYLENGSVCRYRRSIQRVKVPPKELSVCLCSTGKQRLSNQGL